MVIICVYLPFRINVGDYLIFVVKLTQDHPGKGGKLCHSSRNRFGSIRFGSGLFEILSVRFDSIGWCFGAHAGCRGKIFHARHHKSEIPLASSSECPLEMSSEGTVEKYREQVVYY